MRFLSSAATAMLQAAMAALLLLTALVLLQVLCRNVWNLGLPWADELARYCGIAMVFLAMPRLFLDDRHIAVELLSSALPPRGKAVMAAVSAALILLLCLVMLWALALFLSGAGRFATPALGIPNLVFYAPAVLGFLLFAVILIWRLFGDGEGGA